MEELRAAAVKGDASPEEPDASSPEERKHAATRLIGSHDRVFRRTARRYSICEEDGEDAYQRALEILLTKAPPIEGDSLVRWMQVVTKREALHVRRQRERLLSGRPAKDMEELDPLDLIASDAPEPTDRVARRQRVARSGEALKSLKPQEIRALTLKAEGYSYAEIGEITGWTYTKINRCMAEGRKRFLEVFTEIEEGRRCEDLAEALSALVDGETGVERADEVHLHLRSCGPCRAKLRAFRSVPDRVLELAPGGPAVDQSIGGGAHQWLAERAGAATDKLREAGYALMSKGAGDGTGAVAASGGSRGTGAVALGKVLAICGAAAGSATCIAGGVVEPGAVGIGGGEQPTIERPDRIAEVPTPAQPLTPPSSEKVDPVPPVGGNPSPAERAQRPFGFEQQAETAASDVSSAEFGGPSTTGRESSQRGADRGFGFE